MNINLKRYWDSISPVKANWLFRLLCKCNLNENKVIMWLYNIPRNFRSWIICGFRTKTDPITKQKTWTDNYHLFDKLCRYETWDDVKITTWDRFRFWYVTGYKFED